MAATTNINWLSVSPTSSSGTGGNQPVTVTVSANSGRFQRSANLTTVVEQSGEMKDAVTGVTPVKQSGSTVTSGTVKLYTGANTSTITSFTGSSVTMGTTLSTSVVKQGNMAKITVSDMNYSRYAIAITGTGIGWMTLNRGFSNNLSATYINSSYTQSTGTQTPQIVQMYKGSGSSVIGILVDPVGDDFDMGAYGKFSHEIGLSFGTYENKRPSAVTAYYSIYYFGSSTSTQKTTITQTDVPAASALLFKVTYPAYTSVVIGTGQINFNSAASSSSFNISAPSGVNWSVSEGA
jgi:hypothetical protein